MYHAIRQGPQWNETLFVVTFDEHGGTYDHRPPPTTINPGSQRGTSGFNFDRLGVRVPTILVSPFVEAGTVFRAPDGSAHPFDHTSLVKTLLMWAGVDPGLPAWAPGCRSRRRFEDVLADDHVNVHAARPEAAVGRRRPSRDEGMVNHLLEGVPFAALEGDHRRPPTTSQTSRPGSAVTAADPEAFEASLALRLRSGSRRRRGAAPRALPAAGTRRRSGGGPSSSRRPVRDEARTVVDREVVGVLVADRHDGRTRCLRSRSGRRPGRRALPAASTIGA